MGTLSSKPGPHGAVPGWAKFFTRSDYADFERLLERALSERGVRAEIGDGCLMVQHGGGRTETLGLVGLARTCHAGARQRWPAVISAFCGGVLRAGGALPEAGTDLRDLGDLAAVRDRLRVRLHGPGYVSDADPVLCQRPAEGLAAVLFCDLPQGGVAVSAEVAAGWGVGAEALFALARDNVRAEGRLTLHRGVPMSGICVDALFGEGPYAASHVLFLEEYVARSGYGAVVCIPQRNLLFYHVIRDQRLLESIQYMHFAGADLCARSTGPVSPHLYWWRPGQLERLHTRLVGGAMEFQPSLEFQLEVLKPMAQGN